MVSSPEPARFRYFGKDGRIAKRPGHRPCGPSCRLHPTIKPTTRPVSGAFVDANRVKKPVRDADCIKLAATVL
jgi:hypothetical protein